MSRCRAHARRQGFTLVEVMIALVLTAVVGAAVTSVFVSRDAFNDAPGLMASVPAVSAATMMLMELRAVETTDGIIAVGPDSLRVKVPFALGVACGQPNDGLHVSVLPVDSVRWAQGRDAYGGFAWQDAATGGYSSWAGGHVGDAGTPNRCETATPPIRTAFGETGGRSHVVTLTVPAESVSVPVGAPVMLYNVVTYRFTSSQQPPCERGLFRQVDGGAPEKVVATLNDDARFRFYEMDATLAQDAPPTDVRDLRGIELVLAGADDRAAADDGEDAASLAAVVFFRNRAD